MSRPAPLLAVFLAACSLDVTTPGLVRPPNALDVNVDFCAGDLPNWFAVRNEGQPWVVVSRATQQRHSIPVSPRVTIAYGRTTAVAGSIVSSIKVLFVTAQEIEQATCGALIGSKTLYANISGSMHDDVVIAALAGAFGSTSSGSGGARQLFIPGVASGPGDLLVYVATTGDRPKYILRHSIDEPNGTLLDAMDFSSSEATYTVRPPLAINGGVTVQAWTTFVSALGTEWELGAASAPGGVGSYLSLPQHRIGADDMHKTTIVAEDGRRASVYVTVPNALAMSLGPVLSAPTITSVSTNPVLRLRATIPSQAAYPSLASVTFLQGSSLTRSVGVVVSAAYLGGAPTPWEIEVPELTFLGSTLLLNPNEATQWYAETWMSPAGLFFGHNGRTDGSRVRCASAASQPSLLSRACRSPLLLAPQLPPLETGALLSP
ncbi:MAG: hypothetical protein ACRENU_08780 [Gemmatimonadaceae bacterium]